MGSQIKNSWEAIKRLHRLAPNLVHMCRFIWEWICPSRHKVFFKCQTFNSLWKLSNGCTDWHNIWYTSAASSGNGHRINTICPTPQAAFRGGGVRGSQIQFCENCQTAGPIGTKFGTNMCIHLGMDIG